MKRNLINTLNNIDSVGTYVESLESEIKKSMDKKVGKDLEQNEMQTKLKESYVLIMVCEKDIECPICLCDNNQFVKTNCKHFLHIECTDEWLKEKENCPLCRTIINNKVPEKNEIIHINAMFDADYYGGSEDYWL
ncbi:uncharacterized protein LOC126161264 [Schistocerca cancellata]|uniref:uncharacterized protein LOC126161264 n=1 Tax=Schistocerca cancellata TaxID=274614 RepID=UPI002119329E|nr:uncharacterized protein LOC126161264 [Schistocerca cancellata]